MLRANQVGVRRRFRKAPRLNLLVLPHSISIEHYHEQIALITCQHGQVADVRCSFLHVCSRAITLDASAHPSRCTPDHETACLDHGGSKEHSRKIKRDSFEYHFKSFARSFKSELFGRVCSKRCSAEGQQNS